MSNIVTVTNDAGVSFYKEHPFYEAPVVPKTKRLSRHQIERALPIKSVRRLIVARKRAVLMTKLKVPACLTPFKDPMSKPEAAQLLKLLLKYRPDSKVERQQRLLEEAKSRAAGEPPKEVSKNEFAVISGFQAVTTAIEKKTAKLVVIADDVNPIEVVAWMPTLCKKMGVPYVIIKGQSRLGTLVHRKQVSCVALKNIRKEDEATFKQFISAIAH